MKITGEGFYFYKNLPIKWVRIVGVVVAIDDFANLRAYTIDDSSGACIEAIISVSPPPKPASAATGTDDASAAAATGSGPPVGLNGPPTTPYDHIDVGDVVDVKGALSEFRDEQQIKVEKMLSVKGTNGEVALWEKRAKFRADVLDTPWVLDDKAIRKCRREAERSAAEEAKKAQRLKSIAGGKISTLNTKGSRRTGEPATAAASATGKDKAKGKGKTRAERRQMADDVAKLLANSDGKYSALGI